MSNLKATVIIPTHDHASLLPYSVSSVFAQSIPEIEIFIIGDCVSNATREVVEELKQKDHRIRFFDNHEKDPNVGELHRNKALQAAQGEIICYLSDDDLWLPNHIEVMYENLKNAEFTNTLPVIISAHGTIQISMVDLAQPFYRQHILTARNRIPLTFAAHTLEAYRQLPDGWQTTPKGTYSDHHMWKQFLKHQHYRANSSSVVTAVNFPAYSRKEWSPAERQKELDVWQARLADPQNLATLQQEILTACWRTATCFESCYEIKLALSLQDQYKDKQQLAQLTSEATALRSTWEKETNHLNAQLFAIENSLTWRVRNKMLHIPLLRNLLRFGLKMSTKIC